MYAHVMSYIHRELAAHPDQLRGILLQLAQTARVWLQGVDGILAEMVDSFEVVRKGVWVLVVFGGDVGFERVGQQDAVGASEGNLQDVATLHRQRRPADFGTVADHVEYRSASVVQRRRRKRRCLWVGSVHVYLAQI